MCETVEDKVLPSWSVVRHSVSNTGSAVWKGILHGLELLKRGVIWRVGDGEHIRTWRDPWIPRPSSFRLITPKGTCRLNHVLDSLDANGAWRADCLREYFWEMDVLHILKIHTSLRQRSDFLSWFPEKSGVFSVKSAYKLVTCDHDTVFSVGASSAAANGSRSL